MSQLTLDLDCAISAPHWSNVVNELSISVRPQASSAPKIIDTPEDAIEYLRPFTAFRPEQEKFWAIPLDNRGRPRGTYLVSLGTLTSTLVSPRETFRVAIAASAARLLVAHNHPSGDPQPSSADIAITRKIRAASEILDIPLQDHLILGQPSLDPLGIGHYSFRRAGYL
jgi:DNA repair protein RadC